MKTFIKLALAALYLAGPGNVAMAQQATAPAIKVTLLGTASPAPRTDRNGISTLVEAGGQRLVFDAGRGTPINLWRMKIPLGSIDALFVTHFHSDHIGGIPDLWMTSYIPAPYGRRETPFRVIGPTGTVAMMDHLQQAFAPDAQIRIEDEKILPESTRIDATEFGDEGVVWDSDGVVVTAFTVNHGDAIKPAFGYRVDYDGHSVVIGADTKYDENLIKHAQGTDLLIHEVAMARPEIADGPVQSRILGHHTLPAEAGEVFTKVAPKMAVYSHIVLLSTAEVPEPTADDLIAATRATYDGTLVLGEDMMTFAIGDTVQPGTAGN